MDDSKVIEVLERYTDSYKLYDLIQNQEWGGLDEAIDTAIPEQLFCRGGRVGFVVLTH